MKDIPYRAKHPSEALPYGPAYDWIDHLRRVVALHQVYPLRTRDDCANHTRKVLKRIQHRTKLSDNLVGIFDGFITQFLYHNYIYIDHLPDFPSSTSADHTRDTIRHQLNILETYLTDRNRISLASQAVETFLTQLLLNNPIPLGEALFNISYFNIVSNVPQTVQDIFTLADTTFAPQQYLFDITRDDLQRNLFAVSGVSQHDQPRNPRLIQPKDSKETPSEIISTYLANTPFKDLFIQEVPLVIPQEAYFEGQWIVAPQGSGKTQFIQYQIAKRLQAVADGKASIIVMDSQQELIENIIGILPFAKGNPLADRIVLIDANDVDFPVALNIFDLGVNRDAASTLEKERTLNAALETTMFLMDSLLGSDLTGKQAVIFRFIMQAIFAIPNATIYTLKDLLTKEGYQKYKPHLDTLQGAAREFFQTQFQNDKQFGNTKEEIIRRLYGILAIPQWERMFNNPRSKLDLFSEMNAGKVILINTARDLLQPKGCEAIGRFFLCLIAMASQRRATMKGEKIPVYIFIDEAKDYIGVNSADSNFLNIIEQCRKQKVSMTIAHQNLSQFSQRTIDTLQTVAIKCTSSLTDKDAHTMARGMRTKPEYLEQIPKGSFAYFVRNATSQAVTIKIPFGYLEDFHRMTDAQRLVIRDTMRRKYSAKKGEPPPQEPIVSFNERPEAMEPWRLDSADQPKKDDTTKDDDDKHTKPSQEW